MNAKYFLLGKGGTDHGLLVIVLGVYCDQQNPQT